MDITQDTNTVYLFLFGVSILASFIDSIAGGGGLLTTPSMLLVGINPLTVLGTNNFNPHLVPLHHQEITTLMGI